MFKYNSNIDNYSNFFANPNSYCSRNMVKSVNMSELDKKSKFHQELLKFIFTLAITGVVNFFRVINAANLTPGDKFFYYLTIMWYLYFPTIFAKYFGNLENSNKKKEKKILKFWKAVKFYYPPIFTLMFSAVGLTEFSYFLAVLINIIVIDIIGVVYIFTYFGTEEKIRSKILGILGLILLSGFSIIVQLFYPFTRVSPWRILLFEMLWTILFGIGFHHLILKYMKGVEYKNLRWILNLGTTLLIVSLLVRFTAPLTVSNRTPIIAVEGDSMRPFINEGDLVILWYFDPKDIQNGSIIAYYSGNLFNASEPITIHRVINKWFLNEQWLFQTCGDFTGIPDPYIVSGDLIYGVYWFKIAGLGKAIQDLEDMNVFLIAFICTISFLSITICTGVGIFFLRRRKTKHESV